MEEMISMAILLHVIFVVITLVIAVLSFFFVTSDKDFRGFSNRVESLSLQYYIMLAALFFTGLVVLGATSFTISWRAALMIAAICWITYSSVKLHRLFKKTREVDIESQKAFKVYAKRKYIVDMVLIAGVGLLSYAVSL